MLLKARDGETVEVKPELLWRNVPFVILISLLIVIPIHLLQGDRSQPLASRPEVTRALSESNERYYRALRAVEEASSLDEAQEIAGEALR